MTHIGVGHRSLRITRPGQVLLLIALAVGFAALNTGNNLLFFGWGLLLSTILISGILSEASLRGLFAHPEPHDELRAGVLSPLPVVLENRSAQLPAFGVELAALIDEGGTDPRRVLAPYVLRLSATRHELLRARYVPERRGEHRLLGHEVTTAYPFGFFEKSRPLPLATPRSLLVYPPRVDVAGLSRSLLSRLGQAPTRRAGLGDEFFALRPYRDGDDPRLVAWRRSARTQRLMVRETEAQASRAILLELMIPEASKRSSHATEHALAVLGSLAEDLLRDDHAVGLRTAGVSLAPASGPRQRTAILSALARLDLDAPFAPLSARRGVARIALVAPGFSVPEGAEHILSIPASPDLVVDEAARTGRAA